MASTAFASLRMAGTWFGRGKRSSGKASTSSPAPTLCVAKPAPLLRDFIPGVTALSRSLLALREWCARAWYAALVWRERAGPAYFPDGVTTDQSVEHRIGELVREQALRLTRDEVPHAVAVEVDEVRARKGARTVVEARLICETESQKGILVGRGGAMVKAIGTAARPGVEALLGTDVYLEIRVRVRPHWRRDSAELDRLGV